MRTRFLLISCLLLIGLMTGCGHLGIGKKAGADLAPNRDWRAKPAGVTAGNDSETLSPLFEGKFGEAVFPPGTEPWIAVELPSERENPMMLTFSNPVREHLSRAIVDVSTDSTNGIDGTWTEFENKPIRWFLEKTEVTPGPESWVRVRLESRGDPWPEDAAITMTDVGLFELDPNGRNDYWVIIGASIQQQSIQNSVFRAMIAERYPAYDPVIFNEAVGGWRTNQLVERLPGFLEEHPHASYFGIHIGGNNVSGNRPYPGGVEELRGHLVEILEMIETNGQTPILSRLSYRAYHESGDKGPVPPEENGSGPYVTHVFDPLIAEHCPAFYDEKAGRGMVDAYGHFRAHPEELSGDGIHVNDEGAESWNRIWADTAGRVVYTGEYE